MEYQPWLIYALLGAAAAALTGIFAKIGTADIDSNLATAIRACVGAVYLVSVVTVQKKWPHLKSLNPRAVLMLVLAGLAGSTSWLFQYRGYALGGPASKMAALDKLSVPLAVVLAVIFLKEKLVPLNWIGVILIIGGAYLVAYKPAPPAIGEGATQVMSEK